MAIEVIDNLKKEVEALTQKLTAQETEYEKKYKALEQELGLVQDRKTEFTATTHDSVVEKAIATGKDLVFKAKLMERDVTSFDEFKQIAGVIEKAIKPADVPEWLGVEFSNTVLEELRLILKVESLFSKVRMPDGVRTLNVPGKTNEAVAYLIAPGDDAIDSAINSANVSFVTKRFKTLVGVTDQANDETVTAIMDMVRNEMISSLARATEKAIIMGDSGYADANDVKKAFDGLLKMARDSGQTVDNGGGAVTSDNLLELRRQLGVYGLDLSNLVLLVPVDVAYQILDLPEVKTFDQYGNNFTVLAGEIGRIWGMPIVVSEYISHTLKADGTEGDPNTDDKTAVLVVNKSGFAVADRGTVGLETERRAVSSSTLFVSFRDIDFKNISINATPVAALINVE